MGCAPDPVGEPHRGNNPFGLGLLVRLGRPVEAHDGVASLPGDVDALSVRAHRHAERVDESVTVDAGPRPGLADAAGAPGGWVIAPVVVLRLRRTRAPSCWGEVT